MVTRRRRTADAVRAELHDVEARIAAHPLASPRVRAAHQVVDAAEAGDAADVERRLAQRGLPGLAELGRVQLRGTWSWWRLHRRKRALGRELGRA